MKLLFDFFPILLFFIAFKLFGIYVATSVTMVASIIQVGAYWLRHRQFESLHLVTLAMVILLGGSTLLLHNDIYIKWKPTAIYWVFALLFLGSQFIGKKPIIQRLMDSKLSLPTIAWQRLNISWGVFFMVMGIINVYVLYHFSTSAWVNFKLFGTLGLTLLFIIAQAVYLAKYMETKGAAQPVETKNNNRRPGDDF